jgi:hypothetical protein
MPLITHQVLQKAVKELNSKYGLKLRFVTTREMLINQILHTVNDLLEKEKEIPRNIEALYEALLTSQARAEEHQYGEETVMEEDICGAYGVDYSAEDPECQDCDKQEECEELTKKAKEAALVKEAALTKPAPAKEPKKEAKPQKEKKVPKSGEGLSRYGHKLGSMNHTLDDLLAEGATLEQLANALVEKHGIDPKKAAAKVRGHPAWLTQTIGLEFTVTDGVYKATIESF